MRFILIFLLLSSTAFAEEAKLPTDTSVPNRKIDFSKVIMGIDGPFKDCRKLDDDSKKCLENVDLTLGRMCVTAAALPDKTASVVDQVAHGKLAMKLLDAKEMALTLDEIKFLKDQIGKMGYNTIAVSQAIEQLDPSSRVTNGN